VPDEQTQSKFTDPESRIMKTGDGFQPCNDGLLAVGGKIQLIVENKLTAIPELCPPIILPAA
jgi:hypothetical protein